MTGERGTTLIETLIVGSLIVVVVIQLLLAITSVSAAGDRAAEAAFNAATIAVRTGDETAARQAAADAAPGATITLKTTAAGTDVVVSIDVPVVAILGDAIMYTVVGRATVAASPFGSTAYAP
ncbi:MAG: hypothetical protein IIC71_10240 [Acidobacteria bacterium]|nr:hypothetical protein [Acidobacteriota bacterium]